MHRRIRRRTALKALLGLAALAGRWRPAAAEVPWSAIGFSQGGLPLVVHHLGDGPSRVLVLGGQHGWPEANTIELTRRLLAFFAERPGELPRGLRLDVMPVANPDGNESGSRLYLSGVDPNRNWETPDWQPDAFDSNGSFRVGLGGPYPFSEQETRALRDWVAQSRPALIVNYHSAGGFMFGGRDGLTGEVASAYAAASGYHWPAPSTGGARVLGYRTSGTMGVWQREQGIPGIFVELSTPSQPEFERNLAGLQAALGRLGAA